MLAFYGLQIYLLDEDINSVNVEIVSFEVFDRWGNSVYFSSEQNIEWNGNLGNNLLSKGVYTYVLEYKTLRNESKIKAGTITLL